MATIYKKKYPIPMPAGAEIITRRGKKFARWQNGKNQVRTAELLKDGRVMFVADCWYVRYRDSNGKYQRESTGCRERQAAEKVLADIQGNIEKVKAGVMSREEMAASNGLEAPIGKHIKAYLSHLSAKIIRGRRVSPRHVKYVGEKLERAISECRFATLKDLDRQAIQRWMTKLSHTQLSSRTVNMHRAAIIAFCNWCVAEGRLIVNPLAGLPKVQETEPSRKRRPLTEDEIGRLLTAAQKRPLLDALTIRRGKNKGKQLAKVKPAEHQRLEHIGLERALVYKFMMLTGLRRGETASLTVAAVCLDNDSPYVSIEGKHAKSGRSAILPLRADLADDLRKHIAHKTGKLFNIKRNFLRSFNLDLAAAGIAKRDAQGRTLDVHSLRHTFATLLARNGVSPAVAQKLMRHSDIRLTMNTYTQLDLADTAGAVAGLPPI